MAAESPLACCARATCCGRGIFGVTVGGVPCARQWWAGCVARPHGPDEAALGAGVELGGGMWSRIGGGPEPW